jgi:hypothetical protein
VRRRVILQQADRIVRCRRLLIPRRRVEGIRRSRLAVVAMGRRHQAMEVVDSRDMEARRMVEEVVVVGRHRRTRRVMVGLRGLGPVRWKVGDEVRRS